MKKSIVISIPEPCHEDWAKMTPTEKGKFCNSCAKEVVDFTNKTDEDLVKILSKNKNLCGRIKHSQLDREVKLERKSGASFAPLAASMLLPFTLFANTPKTESNSISEKPMISLGIGRFSNAAKRLQIVTTGVVRDKYGNVLKNVEIFSNESNTRTWTNKNGEFEISTWDREILTFSSEDFKKQEIKLTHKSEYIAVIMESSLVITCTIVGKMVAQPLQKIEEKATEIFTKGTVTDDTGLPLPGANVIIKGTSTGTQTDFDGNYKIKSKPGDVLVFTYVGFETKEITVSNISNSIDVKLDVSSASLGLVVVGDILVSEYQPPKDAAWREKVKQAQKNTAAFEKIKRERRKEARKTKRKHK